MTSSTIKRALSGLAVAPLLATGAVALPGGLAAPAPASASDPPNGVFKDCGEDYDCVRDYCGIGRARAFAATNDVGEFFLNDWTRSYTSSTGHFHRVYDQYKTTGISDNHIDESTVDKTCD